jgi:uncharacterized protein (UPF0332 family)
MKGTPTDDLIGFRLQQARETLQEANALYHAAMLRGSINRAYYAMFYAVMALAVFRQEVTAKHSGDIAFFDREFVRKEIFS